LLVRISRPEASVRCSALNVDPGAYTRMDFGILGMHVVFRDGFAENAVIVLLRSNPQIFCLTKEKLAWSHFQKLPGMKTCSSLRLPK
jgi:hypothetical protein